MAANNVNCDFRIKTGFFTHRKTLKLIKRLDYKGVFCLLRLWSDVAQNAPKGDISHYTEEDIAIASGWDDDINIFIKTLIEVGFIDENFMPDGTLKRVIHDWEDNNRYAYYAPERHEQATKAAEMRWQKRKNSKNKHKNKAKKSPANALTTPSDADSIAGSITDSIAECIPDSIAECITGSIADCITDSIAECIADSNAPSPLPTPFPTPSPIPFPDPFPLPKEKEKKNKNTGNPGEDTKLDEKKNICTQVSDKTFVPAATQKINLHNSRSKPKSRNGTGNNSIPPVSFDEDEKSFKGINQFLKKWADAYPLVNVEQEIKQMEAWIISQPKYMWKKDWKRFITNWLSREQDRKENAALNSSVRYKKSFLDVVDDLIAKEEQNLSKEDVR
ncbi:hypothetical protein [Thermodesulfovibrio thiophilus]|uniref:hypothetical protein n=1 Tax=Thermodesulfovibrio thiophilus TaxID=340095 RepID=UPI00041E18C8|nr:hypothetical protein [Thermodesulfovibrio thiophilus]